MDAMIEEVVKEMQRVLNRPFRHDELLRAIDAQRKYLLGKYILRDADELEYNTAWDMLHYFEHRFTQFADSRWAISVRISVLLIFNHHLSQRKQIT